MTSAKASLTTAGSVFAAARSSGQGHRVHVSLEKYQENIRCGDLLLFRGTGWVSRWIGAWGRSRYSHAAMAAWWGELMCLEVREGHGGRIVTLASQVQKFPGRVDVFHINPRAVDFDRLGAVRLMRGLAGCDYGYASVVRAALLHAPFWRFLLSAPTDDLELASAPPYCSQACGWAYRVGGGIDPTPQRPDRITEPGDLATSWFFTYGATLEP